MAPLTAHWRYSTRCNFNCDFCFGLPDPAEEIDVDEKRIIDELVDAGFKYLVFTGGEPSMRKDDASKIIPYAHQKGITITFCTNGTYVDDDFMKVLRDSDATLGLPLYSAKSEIHDSMVKQEGYYRFILTLLEKAKNIGLKTKINTMVSKQNKDSLLEIGNIIEKYGCSHWNLPKFRVYRRALSSKDDYDITDDEFSVVINEIKEKYPSINLIWHVKNEDSKGGYFFITRDGKVVQPAAGGKENFIGDLKTEPAKELVKRINRQENERKTQIERVMKKGEI